MQYRLIARPASKIEVFTETEKMSRSRFLKGYLVLSGIFTTLLVIFVLVNFVIVVISVTRDFWLRAEPGDPVVKYGMHRIASVYPELDHENLSAFMKEWRRSVVHIYEPFTQFAHKPMAGQYINISQDGFRVGKLQGQWPPSGETTNIFVFGGSTTFGLGVPDKETIPSHLQDILNARRPGGEEVRVYNFGRSAYFSTMEGILFLRLLQLGFRPDTAVFIDGLNEFYYVSGLPMYTTILKDFMDDPVKTERDLTIRALKLSVRNLPLAKAVKGVTTEWRENRVEAGRKNTGDAEAGKRQELQAVIDRYLSLKKIIRGIGKGFGVDTVFVWQPVPTYKYEPRYHAFWNGDLKALSGHSRSRQGYGLFNERRGQRKMDEDFLWLAHMQERRTENLYVDVVHYTGEFSRDIAREIAGFMDSRIDLR